MVLASTLLLPSWRLPPPIAKLPAQLELGLFRNEPWEGRSPRVLTRGRLGVIFNPRGEKSTSDFVIDPLQMDLFPRREAHRKRSPERRPSFAAALLIPLPPEKS